MKVDDDVLVIEEPLEIRIADEPLAVTMRTPGHDCDLVAGFCLTEGIVTDPDEIESLEECGEAEYGNVMAVTLTDEAMQRRMEQITCARRELYLSSSCGLCGKQSIDRIYQRIAPIRGNFTIARDTLAALPETMRTSQATFSQTGGLHAAGIFTPGGVLNVLREDVGRHNAVDKVVGQAIRFGLLPLHDTLLAISGRAGFEIIQKARRAGIPVICSVSAPSSLAVELAADGGQTLVGFLRGDRFNVYTGGERFHELPNA